MMELYLIRHAESENNAKPPQNRVEDPPITAAGRLQAEALSQWMKTLAIDWLVTSPVRRALQTTRYITQQTGHHTQVWADVFEEGGIYRGFGPDAVEGGPGLSRTEIICLLGEIEHSTLDDSIQENGWWNRDRETPQEARVRAAAVTDRLVKNYGDTDNAIAAVIHADFKRKLIDHMMDDVLDAGRLGPLRNTGVSKLNFDGSRWHLDWYNSVTHLPARLITGVEH